MIYNAENIRIRRYLLTIKEFSGFFRTIIYHSHAPQRTKSSRALFPEICQRSKAGEFADRVGVFTAAKGLIVDAVAVKVMSAGLQAAQGLVNIH